MLSNIIPDIEIQTPTGTAVITNIQITELGYVYISLKNIETKCTVNYRVGDAIDLLNKSFKTYDTNTTSTNC